MYLQDQVNNAPVSPIAIVGAALRFPGAYDPASYHELTAGGHRMFRELARAAIDRGRVHSNGTGPLFSLDGVPLRAALLDGDEPLDGRSAGRAADDMTARRALAVGVAAAALADIPETGRLTPGTTGIIIADTPDPGMPGVEEWVGDRIGLTSTGASGGTDRDGLGGTPLPCSLRAVAAACEALNAGERDLVLAGGVSTGVDPAWLSHRARAGGLASGDVRIYDASPSGTLPGEGCGVVALMRASDARSAGLPAYAEIAGWHAADAGPEPGNMRSAYLRAGIDPADVQLVEGHGAATASEDLAELGALAEVLGPRQSGAAGRCALGAVPANIGDTGSAAGIAALLKAALAMTAGMIPPSTGCVRPHRLLAAGTTPFRMPLAAEPWPENAVQVAAVNSLGIAARPGAARSGTVHIVLRREQPTGHRAGRRRRTACAPDSVTTPAVPAQRSAPALGAARRAAGAHAIPPRPREPSDARSPAQPGEAAQREEAA
jgi:acyl transferase domain-containing protein